MHGYELDLKGLVKALGGPMACWRRLQAVGVDVQPATINKWLERDDIAAVYLVNLLAHRALNEGPMDLNAFITPARDPSGPRLVRCPRPQPEPQS